MSLNVVSIRVLLPKSTHEALARLACLLRTQPEEYASLLIVEALSQAVTKASTRPAIKAPPAAPNGSPHTEEPSTPANDPRPEAVPENQIIRHLIEELKKRGGAARKHEIENAIFEKLKKQFHHPYYAARVGGGVARWRKNVQFARNTAKNIGLLKLPDESGRGIWELTEKGRTWQA